MAALEAKSIPIPKSSSRQSTKPLESSNLLALLKKVPTRKSAEFLKPNKTFSNATLFSIRQAYFNTHILFM